MGLRERVGRFWFLSDAVAPLTEMADSSGQMTPYQHCSPDCGTLAARVGQRWRQRHGRVWRCCNGGSGHNQSDIGAEVAVFLS